MEGESREQRPLGDLIKHTAIYGSGFVATAAVSLVLVPVYTHYLSPSEYGLLALLLVLYGLMKVVYDLGFTNSVARFYFDEKGADEAGAGLSQMSSTALAFLAVFGGLLTAALWLFDEEMSRLLTGGSGHGNLVRIVAVMLYAETLAIVPLTMIRMQERSSAFVLITIARLVGALALSLVFVVLLDRGVEGALLGNAVPSVGVLLLLLPEYRRIVGAAPSQTLLRQMLAFGLPFFPVLLSGWLIDASDRYLLELFRSREEVGFYSLAYRIVQVMQLAVAAFSMGWAPLRYRIYAREDAREIYRRLTTYYVLAAGLLSVAIAVFAGAIIAVVSPPSYAPAASVVPLLVLAYAMQGLYYLMVTGMGVTKQTMPMVWISGAAVVLNIGINLLLVPAWGMKGAALTTVLAYVVLVGGTWLYSQRVYPIPYDWSRIARVAIIGAAIVGVSTLASPAGALQEFAVGLAAWLAFVFVLVKTRTINREELAMARAWTRRGTLWMGQRWRGRKALG